MRFYLGTHMTGWMSALAVPLFVSRRRLAKRKRLPASAGPFAIDSGGFQELDLFGQWTVTADQYAEEVRRWSETIGNVQWAAAMDWMCEPFVVRKTGLSVAEHQRRTVASIRELRDLAPGLPWVPVLQGYTHDEYYRCWDMYEAAGLDLTAEPLVGLGSVCRRQGTTFAAQLIRDLAQGGLRLHGFGLKTTGLAACAEYLTSADSMAWSAAARRRPVRLPGCSHLKCASCLKWALKWRRRVLRVVEQACQRRRESTLWSG